MSIIQRIQWLNDTAKIGGSQGVDRIYLSILELDSVLEEWPWLKHYWPLKVDGVLIYWNGR